MHKYVPKAEVEAERRGPGRPSSGRAKVPSLRRAGLSTDLAAQALDVLRALNAARDAGDASAEPSYSVVHNVAGAIEAAMAERERQRVARSAAMQGVRRRAASYLVERVDDRGRTAWHVDTIGQAAAKVGLSAATVRQYLSTSTGGPVGQWSTMRGDTAWRIERLKTGTEHAAQTEPEQNV